ncbi:SigE family RNA polymerase sigma factor [Nocardioides sp.]|uniref:SigE family RNA polymerase sigma factor n=1 Tax=Nocardioides sp. TaxID=35761 RepID=UPI002B26DB86|nr:SigE family RNA polymerase sigma factor [Nocardioides sp.]
MSGAEVERVGFDDFVRARRGALLRTAYLLTGEHADAEDLVQSALIKSVPHWRKISDNPEPYVRRILARESVSRWRRRRWREVSSDVLPEPALHDPDVAAREDLRRALAGLAPRQRAVIVLRYFEDLSEAETAEALHIGVGTVKSQTRDALRVLRTRMPTLEVDLLPTAR